MTSIIVAGGKSQRLGRSKLLETIGDKPLIQWVIDRMAAISTEIIIATGQGEAIPCSSAVEIKTVTDVYPGRGPLAGIYSGLMVSSHSQALVVGCDMPFLNIRLLKYMSQTLADCDVALPRIGKMVEPLCAVYSKTCLAPIRNLLEHDERQIRRLFSAVKVRYVEEEEVDRFDPDHLSFFNVNSQDDLERARKLATDKVGV